VRARLRAVAEAIDAYIQAGGRDLTKHLHLDRSFAALDKASSARIDRIRQLRIAAEADCSR